MPEAQRGKVVPIPNQQLSALRELGSEGIQVSSEMEAFLGTLEAVDPQTWLETVPGLGSGAWQARWVRKGIRMGAITLHASGLCLCLSADKSDELFRQMRWTDEHSPRAVIQPRTAKEVWRMIDAARAARRRHRPAPPLDDF